METKLDLPGFEGQNIEFKGKGVFGTPTLYVNGQPQKPVRRRYEMRDTQGRLIEVKVKLSYLDVYPKLEVDGKLYATAKPFSWYEYIWIGLPLSMIAFGGAIGGGLGGGAAYINAYLFRSQLNGVLKYLFAALVSLAAFILWAVIVAWLQATVFKKAPGAG